MQPYSVLIISDNYPSQNTPTRGIFIYQLAQHFAKRNSVKVICPTVIIKNSNRAEPLQNDSCTVIYPYYLSFSISNNSILRSIKRHTQQASIKWGYKKLYNKNEKPTFIYAHFLWNAITVIPLVDKLNVPLFVAMGESNTHRYENLVNNTTKRNKITRQISGFIVVSEKMRQYCINKLKIDPQNILLAPNGVDTKKLYPLRNKIELRNKLGFDKEMFTISFLGSFIERKGIFDIFKSIEHIENIQIICIGKGKLQKTDKIVFSAPLPHEDINKYLNASDAFVLPTYAEGSSNALLEAAATGLPVITSNIPEVMEQFGNDNALYVTPGNLEELKNAIVELKNNEQLRTQLSEKSLQVSKKYSLEKRAQNILKWIGEKIAENE